MATKPPSKKKGKSRAPDSETLAKSEAQVRSLRDQLSRTVVTADTSEYRRQRALDSRNASADTLEQVRQSTQQHTAFMVTQHEVIVSNLNEKVNQLEKNVCELTATLECKRDELDRLKMEFSGSLADRDLLIDRLKGQLTTQGELFEDTLTQAFNKLTNYLAKDYDKVTHNYQPWSENLKKMAELEYLRPPFFDKESTEYY